MCKLVLFARARRCREYMVESAFVPNWSRRRGVPIDPGIPVHLWNRCYCSLNSRNLAGGHRPGDETSSPGRMAQEHFLLFPCRPSHQWQFLARKVWAYAQNVLGLEERVHFCGVGFSGNPPSHSRARAFVRAWGCVA